MRMIALVLCVLGFAAPSHAAQKTRAAAQDVASMEKKCRAMVGREVPEATDGRSHEGQLNVQRFSMCLMGKLPAIDCLLLQGLYEVDLQALCR